MLRLHALHAVAYAALRLGSPATASRVVGAAARRARVQLDADSARRALGGLRGGTCLSRALAVAAVLPGAEVVIGVRPGDRTIANGVHAHAWVELSSLPLREQDPIGHEIARVKPSRVMARVVN